MGHRVFRKAEVVVPALFHIFTYVWNNTCNDFGLSLAAQRLQTRYTLWRNLWTFVAGHTGVTMPWDRVDWVIEFAWGAQVQRIVPSSWMTSQNVDVTIVWRHRTASTFMWFIPHVGVHVISLKCHFAVSDKSLGLQVSHIEYCWKIPRVRYWQTWFIRCTHVSVTGIYTRDSITAPMCL